MRILLLTKYGARGASTRYRALQYIPFLEAKGWSVEWQPLLSDRYLEILYREGRRSWPEVCRAYAARLAFLARTDLREYDAVYLQYEAFPYVPLGLESALLGRAANLVIDYDDAIFTLYQGKPLLEDKIPGLMRGAREVIAGNAFLEEHARRSCERVTVIPTVIDLDKYRTKDDYERRDPRGPVIGWIGTPVTARYLATLARPLQRLARAHPFVLRSVGTPGDFAIPGVRVENVRWSEDSEAELIRTFDIGVMPLAREAFAYGKCGLKLIQYMGCAVPAAGAKLGANEEIIRHGADGYLASTDDEYVEILERLMADQGLCERIGRAGRETVEKRYALQSAAADFCEVVERAAGAGSRVRAHAPAHDSPAEKRTTILRVSTSPLALWFFFQNLTRHLHEHGFDTIAVSSPGEKLDEFQANTGAKVHAVPMKRTISPFSDLPAIFRLWRLIRNLRPDIVHAHTPKAGLLGMIAAKLAGARIRVYTIHGLPLMTRTGWQFYLLRLAETVACRLATHVYCVSHSVRQVAIDLNICRKEKIRTPGYGSCAGVSLEKFDPARHGGAERLRIRARYGVPQDALLMGYVGRLVRDKGIAELGEAWARLREEIPNLHLLCCGEFEAQDPVPEHVRQLLGGDPRVHFTGEFVADMPPIYAALDICVLPTYREGLPTVALEAAAMQVPIVATRVAGCIDSIRNGVTGLLVEPRSAGALATAIARLARDPELRGRLGRAAREFVALRFSEEQAFKVLRREYERQLHETVKPSGMAKRVLDVAGALAGMAFLAPVAALVAAGIRLRMGSPILFRQWRAGRGGRPFLLHKFRTMTEARDSGGSLLPDAGRLTRLGSLLRRLSLDELPQLWNVLRGDMSLVGPRPLHAEYVRRYSPEQRRRLALRPGLTGWAQIHGRNAITWERKFELDVWYVEHRSFLLDLKILAATVLKVWRGEGISHAGHATMPDFVGTLPRETRRAAETGQRQETAVFAK